MDEETKNAMKARAIVKVFNERQQDKAKRTFGKCF